VGSKHWIGPHLTIWSEVLVWFLGTWTVALAQNSTKPAIDIWRPKDGLYGFDNGTAFAVPCENLPLHYIELSKRLIAANEIYKCKVTKLTDVAADTLRLDVNCDDATDGKSRGVMMLRKIDEKSFLMGWRGRSESRFVYCHPNDERGDSK